MVLKWMKKCSPVEMPRVAPWLRKWSLAKVAPRRHFQQDDDDDGDGDDEDDDDDDGGVDGEKIEEKST